MLITIISLLFAASIMFEVIAVFPRISGSILNLNGVGYSVSLIILTLKRVFASLYPPALGALVVFGDEERFFVCILVSYLLSGIAILFVIFAHTKILEFFVEFISRFHKSSLMIQSMFGAAGGLFTRGDMDKETESHIRKIKISLVSIDYFIVKRACWIYFFYSSAVFILNYGAIVYPQNAPVILQMSGILGAFGTLVLALNLDPQLSRRYETKEELSQILSSLLLAHMLNVIVVSPVVFISIYFLKFYI